MLYQCAFYNLQQRSLGSAKSSHKPTNSKYSRLYCHSPYHNHLTLPVQCKISQRQHVNKEADHIPLKLYLWRLKIKFHINVMGHEVLFFRFYFQPFKNAKELFFAHRPYQSGNGLDLARETIVCKLDLENLKDSFDIIPIVTFSKCSIHTVISTTAMHHLFLPTSYSIFF